jgi:aspartyl-tRNA(Asn)/glutamyl-tRNA(Gln) amidotransferase subunit A
VTQPTAISELTASRRAIEDILARAEADNPAGNIYTQILGERALRAAFTLDASSTAPLRGVPLAIKDNLDLAGFDTTCGRRLRRDPAAESAAVVRRLEALGAVIIGKTNLDEAALGATGRNPRFGRCVNPRFEDRLSGGSSSGAAASIAAGHTRVSVGTDTLGSVRIPAAFCGVAGFKPSHGRLPTTGVTPLYPRFDTIGLLGRSLGDLQTAAIPLLGGRTLLADPPAHAVTLAVLDDAALLAVDPAMAYAYRRCVQILRTTPDCRVLQAVAIDWAGTAHAALWEIAHHFATLSSRAARGYPALDDLDAGLRRFLDRAMGRAPDELAAGRRLLSTTGTRLSDCVETAALLTPTCPLPAPPADADLPRNIAAFVAPANVAGLPAVAWPQDVRGTTPLSLQLIGRIGDDLRVLGLAAWLQHRLDRAFDVGERPSPAEPRRTKPLNRRS